MEKNKVCLNNFNINDSNICYGYIDSFHEWEETVRKSANDKDDQYKGRCSSVKTHNSNDATLFNEDVCKKTMLFFREIRSTNEKKAEIIGCKHLFYWLYKKTMNPGGNYELTKRAYDAFKKIYKDYTEDVCTNREIDICENEMKKVDHMYDIYNCLYEIEHEGGCKDNTKNCISKFKLLRGNYEHYCKSNRNDDLCEEIILYTNKFKEKVENLNCGNSIYQMIFSYLMDDKRRHIVYAIFAGLLISLLLIHFFMFNPLGKHLLRELKKEINEFYDEDDEWDIYELSDMNRSASTDSVYNILYDSTNYTNEYGI
ncbi:variable surface protein [Plasmodium gonderi]|uniref:Variable surface protein n=1 Tax=Plasmodium gonderi TaxID=77519 RepID=A0A1Y1JNS8_PLAGO|nr:variable surface protein [Plasmodium gonderi]GAW84246.1 variable surface protein [Plasmodium gonderi]